MYPDHQHKLYCTEALINCENVLISVTKNGWTDKLGLMRVCNECADICAGMLYALNAGSANISKFALLCAGICQECYEMCSSFKGNAVVKKCAEACLRCSDSIINLYCNTTVTM